MEDLLQRYRLLHQRLRRLEEEKGLVSEEVVRRVRDDYQRKLADIEPQLVAVGIDLEHERELFATFQSDLTEIMDGLEEALLRYHLGEYTREHYLVRIETDLHDLGTARKRLADFERDWGFSLDADVAKRVAAYRSEPELAEELPSLASPEKTTRPLPPPTAAAPATPAKAATKPAEKPAEKEPWELPAAWDDPPSSPDVKPPAKLNLNLDDVLDSLNEGGGKVFSASLKKSPVAEPEPTEDEELTRTTSPGGFTFPDTEEDDSPPTAPELHLPAPDEPSSLPNWALEDVFDLGKPPTLPELRPAVRESSPFDGLDDEIGFSFGAKPKLAPPPSPSKKPEMGRTKEISVTPWEDIVVKTPAPPNPPSSGEIKAPTMSGDSGSISNKYDPRNIAVPVLRVISTKNQGYFHPLNRETVTIGRLEDNNIVLSDDSAVSRYHSHIEYRDGRYFAVDLKSSNGTQVNGVKVKAQALSSNDIVSVGRTTIIFIDNQADLQTYL